MFNVIADFVSGQKKKLLGLNLGGTDPKVPDVIEHLDKAEANCDKASLVLKRVPPGLYLEGLHWLNAKANGALGTDAELQEAANAMHELPDNLTAVKHGLEGIEGWLVAK